MNVSNKPQHAIKGALVQCLLIALSFMPVLCLNLINDTEPSSAVVQIENADAEVAIEMIRP